MSGQQGIAGHVRAHLAVAQDEVRQDGEHSLAGGALDAPDGETTQTDPRIMGVAREAPALTAAGLVEELKTEGEEEGEDACDKRFGVAQERTVGRLIAEVNGDRAVVAYRFGGVAHVSFPVQWSLARSRHGEGNTLKDQVYGERLGAPPLNSLECALAKERPPVFGMIQRCGQVVINMMANVKQKTIEPFIKETITPGTLVYTDEYSIYARLCAWGYDHKSVNHGRGEYARDEDGDGFCEVHVNTMEGFWSLLRSWLRPHRGISQEKLPLYLGFFEFVHNIRQRGKALLHALIELLVT
jgi:transposase-like protein